LFSLIPSLPTTMAMAEGRIRSHPPAAEPASMNQSAPGAKQKQAHAALGVCDATTMTMAEGRISSHPPAAEPASVQAGGAPGGKQTLHSKRSFPSAPMEKKCRKCGEVKARHDFERITGKLCKPCITISKAYNDQVVGKSGFKKCMHCKHYYCLADNPGGCPLMCKQDATAAEQLKKKTRKEQPNNPAVQPKPRKGDKQSAPTAG
jgi:hypothetical protein